MRTCCMEENYRSDNKYSGNMIMIIIATIILIIIVTSMVMIMKI